METNNDDLRWSSRVILSPPLPEVQNHSRLRLRAAHRGQLLPPQRVQRRLVELSTEAQGAGQFGPAVRAEELLGKSIGMWIDQSLQLSGALNGSHVAALLEQARKRQLEPIDNSDDGDDNGTQRQDERD